jgi:hypothetical protein
LTPRGNEDYKLERKGKEEMAALRRFRVAAVVIVVLALGRLPAAEKETNQPSADKAAASDLRPAPAPGAPKPQKLAFSATRIRKLREEAVKISQVPQDGANGWSKSTVDPNKVLELFKPLRLRKGYVLRAYQFREEGNGNGVVWAMPVDAEFPDPKDCPTLESHLFKAPKPTDALDDAMDAIEGDGTPWSYLAASMARRELSDFGAAWHGVHWGFHFVLDEDPWMADPPKPDEPALDRPTTKAAEWTWLEDAPKDWRPRVAVDKDRVTVTFYTYSGLETQRLYRHTDTYKPGKLRPKVEEKVIAHDGPGFMP